MSDIGPECSPQRTLVGDEPLVVLECLVVLVLPSRRGKILKDQTAKRYDGHPLYSWLQKFWPKTQILLGNGLLL